MMFSSKYLGLITCISIYGAGNTEHKYKENHVCSPITTETKNRSHGITEYFASGFLIFFSFFLPQKAIETQVGSLIRLTRKLFSPGFVFARMFLDAKSLKSNIFTLFPIWGYIDR